MEVRVPRALREDLPRKFVAAFFALLIWSTVRRYMSDFVILTDVPVRLKYDRGALVTESIVLTVDLTLLGARKRLLRVKSSDVEVSAEIPSSIPPGYYFYDVRLSPDNVTTPPGTRVSDIAPAQHRVQLDRIVEKRNVPIRRMAFEGTLAEGYRPKIVSVLPAAVILRGPSRLLKDIREVAAEPVVLDETIRQDFQLDVKLLAGPEIHTQSHVRVNVAVTRYSSERPYKDLSLNVLKRVGSPLRLREPPPTISVTLQGPKGTLGTLDDLSIRPFVDITAITSPGTYRRPVQVWIDGAADVTAGYVYPSVVELVLAHGSAASEETPAAPPEPGEDAGNNAPK